MLQLSDELLYTCKDVMLPSFMAVTMQAYECIMSRMNKSHMSESCPIE